MILYSLHKRLFIIRLNGHNILMPVFDDHTMIQTEESFDDVYISDITKRHISVGREPALIDNEIFHFLIQVYRFYHLEGIGCIQYALYHAHDDDSHKDADDSQLDRMSYY